MKWLFFVWLGMSSLPAYSCCHENFLAGNNSFSVAINQGEVVVKRDGLEVLRQSALEPSDGSAFFSDFNFDGYPDFALLRESGIEKYFDVYIFDSKKNGYYVHDFLSSIPCPQVDIKNKKILSACNHVSSCEHWQDQYQYVNGNFVLERRDGVTCDPKSGKGFNYYEIFNSGVLIEQKTFESPE